MRAAVFYATEQGHTRRIAERIAADLGACRLDTEIHDVTRLAHSASVDWTRYSLVCVAASVHVGRHEPAMIAFVKRYRHELERRQAVFVSVSLSQAGAIDPRATTERRARSVADVTRMFENFVEETGWRPARWLPVAGALAYTRYNVVLRFIMKRIARTQGGPTDTSRDHVLTDWAALDRFVAEIAAPAA